MGLSQRAGEAGRGLLNKGLYGEAPPPRSNPLPVEKQVQVYTHFKKGCRREQRMAIVERRLYDRKELWVLNIDGK